MFPMRMRSRVAILTASAMVREMTEVKQLSCKFDSRLNTMHFLNNQSKSNNLLFAYKLFVSVFSSAEVKGLLQKRCCWFVPSLVRIQCCQQSVMLFTNEFRDRF